MTLNGIKVVPLPILFGINVSKVTATAAGANTMTRSLTRIRKRIESLYEKLNMVLTRGS